MSEYTDDRESGGSPQNRRRYEEILESVSCGVALYTVEAPDSLSLTYVNIPACRLTGMERGDYERHPEYLFTPFVEEDATALRTLALRCSKEVVSRLVRAKHRDGHIFWVRASLSELPDFIGARRIIATYESVDDEIRARDALRYHAEYDALTGIYNRDTFYRNTAIMLREHPDTRYVLIRWNVERFKMINELFGRSTGDAILKEIASAFAKDIPAIGTFGRLENDHFAICFPLKLLNIELLTERVSRCFRAFDIGMNVIVGMGIYEIVDPELPVDQMCDRANMALQTVKGDYRVHYAFYDDQLRESMLKEQEIRDRMQRALRDREFEVYLQPVFSLQSNAPVSAEALVRWKSKTQGFLSPGVFIPVFESTGFISELDYYVWDEVCHILQRRRQKGLTPISVSVNASRRTLYDPNLYNRIVSLTREHGVDPDLFKIEITETAYTDNPEQLLETVKKLQAHGFPVLMDDFGSGYSSLNTLKDIPVDMLKIDMKFLQGFEKGGRVGTILTSILRMAKWLGIPVIAEGVETGEQTAFLKSIGCDWIQGYVYAKPMPYDEFEEYVLCHGAPEAAEPDESYLLESIDQLMGGNTLVNRLLGAVLGAFGVFERIQDRLEIVRVNDAYYDRVGYLPPETAVNVWDMYDDENRQASMAACDEAIKTRKPVRVTLTRRHADGHPVTLSCVYGYLGGGQSHALFCVAFVN